MTHALNSRSLRAELRKLNAALRASEAEYALLICRLSPGARADGENLAAYLALRREGNSIRQSLGEIGLALAARPVDVADDIGRLEALLAQGSVRRNPPGGTPGNGERVLWRRCAGVFGAGARAVRVMVTAPDDAAEEARLIRGLLSEGVTAVRINCARGNAETWRRIVSGVRDAEKRTGKPCRVMMDLAGPKVRTSAVEVFRGDSAVVKSGDRFLLVPTGVRIPRQVRKVSVAAVTTTEPSVLADLRKGERVLIDDGKIRARIREKRSGFLEVEVEQTRSKGGKLRPERSLNFPDSNLPLSGLTGKDRDDIAVAAELADMIGLSFVKDPSHVAEARELLSSRNAERVGIVLKVENRAALDQLPLLLFEALRAKNSAVLIARGDLAAECGFESLAHVQKDVADMAHAARIPVILATQVLERMVRTGLPSRAEMGDLAFAAGIECLLLNKGPFVREAARFLRGWLSHPAEHRFISM